MDPKPLADGLWVIDGPLKRLGIEFGHRMTVIRGSRGIVLHSPVEHGEALHEALARLGPVQAVLAPSLFHDLYFPRWIERYPEAVFLAAPGFRAAHPRLADAFGGEITAATLEGLDAGLDTVWVEGMPRVNECVVLHRPSRTLIVADLLFNFPEARGAWRRMFLSLNQSYGGPSCSRLFRLMVRDRGRFRGSVQRILELDFDRVVMGHGTVIERGGRDQLRNVCSRVLQGR